MPDSNLLPLIHADDVAADYLSECSPATTSLRVILAKNMASGGALSFADFMAIALYEPALGYYARQTRQVGRGGDFFTSVSVGPLFGELLARRFLREWQQLGKPSSWRILEIAAHDGTLAADILATIQKLEPSAFGSLEYSIVEPLPVLQAAQREKLESFAGAVRFVSSPEQLAADPKPGIVFGNELLDALPFQVLEWTGNCWLECRVHLTGAGGFSWKPVLIEDPEMNEFLAQLGIEFPKGYRTEVRLNFKAFLEPLIRCISAGVLIWPDYGFARPEYYHPDRVAGTLRTFSKHRAGENPLANPGEVDITAHVDFTAVAEAAMELGCPPSSFCSQGVWLTQLARDWLLQQEGNPDLAGLRQFQTLTHPAHLGGSFYVLELSWNQGDREISLMDSHRLALRACRAAKSQ